MKEYKSSPVGVNYNIEYFGINERFLDDSTLLRRRLKKYLEQDGFGIMDVSEKKFNPHGMSIYFLLSESHLAIHTYPEYSCIAIQFYTCRGPNDGKNVIDRLKQFLKPKYIALRKEPIIIDFKMRKQLGGLEN